ncbi:unnamed protein product [Linum tenue]|uniref:F-box/LRR-repeat protein 15-like leucin rich repeat domain-containing protein n=1 Tax=Linum tenue TaxID=586396 RepID=A0AAV0JZE9_9ROSI|nr:unnamed protein product [Linum tenue]
MASSSSPTSINEALTDDELRSILGKLEDDKDKEIFGLVCKRWLRLQSTERRKLAARAGPHMLQKMAARFSRLLELDLSQSVSSLKSLHLAGCRFITDEILKSLSTYCTNLEELGLQGCSNITDSGLEDLVAGCRRIQFLDINKCSNVGDSGISSVSKACSASLRTLKLLDCYKVGDESIFSLARHCVNLETLIIGGCRDISDESCPFVTKLECDEAGLTFPESCKVNFNGSLNEPDVLV